MSVTGLNRAAKALAIESTLASNIPPITTANDVNATLGLALKNACILSTTGAKRSCKLLKAAFKSLQERLAPVIDKIQAFFRANPKVAFTSLAVVIGGILLASVLSLASAFAALFSPVTLIIVAIAALAG